MFEAIWNVFSVILMGIGAFALICTVFFIICIIVETRHDRKGE